MKYLEKFKEHSKKFKRNIVYVNKTCRNSGRNDKNLTKFYGNTSVITHLLSVQFFDTSAPSRCGIPI